MQNLAKKIRIAAIGDLHVRETSNGAYSDMFREMSEKADVIVLCGDLTDLGFPKEAEVLGKEVAAASIPVLAVFGNHDFESNKQTQLKHILEAANITVLEGTEYILKKNEATYGFTGVKGFGGGFRPYIWGRIGEHEQKVFYDAVGKEVQQLENGLNRLQANDIVNKVVLMHYSPIRETLKGELEELYPFLGSSRLEEVIDRYDVATVIHAHAHHGSPFGKTEKNIPVYNVSRMVNERAYQQKYVIIEA